MFVNSKELKGLREAGLISTQQEKAIQYYLSDRKQQGTSGWLTVSLQLLASLLLTFGVGMLISAYWYEWSNGVKLSIGVAMLVMAWLGWYTWREKRPSLAQGLAVIGSGIWFADVFMYHFIYSCFADTAEIVFVCFLGIVLIPFISRQVALIGVVAANCVALWESMSEQGDSVLNLHLQNHIALTGLLLIGVLWSLLGEKWRTASGTFRNYGWVSIPSTIAFICYLHVFVLYEHATPNIVCLLLCLVPLPLHALLKPREYAWRWWLLSGAVTCIAMLGMFTRFPGWEERWCSALGTFICVLFAAVQMLVGVKCRRVAWINYGTFMAVLTMVGIVTNIFKSLESSGLLLILCGLVLLPLAWLLERSRRSMVKLASRSSSSFP